MTISKMPATPPANPSQMTLEQLSAAYAAWTSGLSDRIKGIEDYLNSLPGKVEVGVPGNKLSEHQLRFVRSGSAWKLCFPNKNETGHFTGTFSTLSDASIDTKAEFAQFLPELVKKLFETMLNKSMPMLAAHEALNQADALLPNKPSGGKSGEPAQAGVNWGAFLAVAAVAAGAGLVAGAAASKKGGK